MKRAYNFNAGPSALPEEVLGIAAEEMLDWHGKGISVMEMSHRTADFDGIIGGAEAKLRSLLGMPDNYKVLFLQGGGTQQFAAVPMNLMLNGKADYVLTGTWSNNAFKEAKFYGQPHALATSEDAGFTYIPDCSEIRPSEDASYVYICLNETIGGIEWSPEKLPQTGNTPLVADVSSCFLSEPMDINRYGLVWGGAQKNVGPAGVTIVVVREDLVHEDVLPFTPTIMRYTTMVKTGSLYNTPPCWCIYMCGLVFDWIIRQGGLEGMKKRNTAKAKMLYDFLDASNLFTGLARPDSRSIMNVTFSCKDAEKDAAFIRAATEAGFLGIKGHRSFGGMRASIYNAVPPENVEALCTFMEDYERTHN